MNRVIVGLTNDEGLYTWRLREVGGYWLDDALEGTLDELAEYIGGRPCEVWLLLPGTRVITHQMAFSPQERKHLVSITPFQLEDSVATDVDLLHFALAAPGETEVAVAYTDKDWLTALLEKFSAHNVDVQVCTPESLMLPRNGPGSWCLRFDDQVTVHYGDGLGFSIEPGLIMPALEALLTDIDPPEQVLLLADDKFGLTNLKAILPSEFKAQVEESLTDTWDSFGLADNTAINLRQGDLARRLPIERWWQEWKTVAIVAGITILIYAGVNIGGYQALKAENVKLRQQIEQAYRSVVPRGRITDAEKQLKSKVNALKGSSSSGSAIQIIGRVAPLIAANKDISVKSINYAGKRNELRLDLLSKSFKALESLRVEVEQKGLKAEMLNAVAQGDSQQARMRITQVL